MKGQNGSIHAHPLYQQSASQTMFVVLRKDLLFSSCFFFRCNQCIILFPFSSSPPRSSLPFIFLLLFLLPLLFQLASKADFNYPIGMCITIIPILPHHTAHTTKHTLTDTHYTIARTQRLKYNAKINPYIPDFKRGIDHFCIHAGKWPTGRPT